MEISEPQEVPVEGRRKSFGGSGRAEAIALRGGHSYSVPFATNVTRS